jgi:hypothetical protein
MSRAVHEAMREFSLEDVWYQWEAAIMEVLSVCPLVATPSDGGIPVNRARQEPSWTSWRIPQISDWLRRGLRRFPDFPDGWAELPGTVAALPASTQVSMLAKLRALDEALRGKQRSARVGS